MTMQTIKTIEIAENETIHTPSDCYPLFKEFYYMNEIAKKQEIFSVMALDGSHNVIGIFIVSIGTVNRSLVHPREIFKTLYTLNASAFIMAHNHPSGHTEPSEEDLNTTKRIIETSEILGIQLLDHIIIATPEKESFYNEYFSFRERDFLESLEKQIKENPKFQELM